MIAQTRGTYAAWQANERVIAATDSGASQTPETQALTLASRIFADVTGIDIGDADADKTFLELGFDSLLLTQATAKLKTAFKVNLRFRQLLENFTSLRALAAHLAPNLPQAPGAAAVATVPPPDGALMQTPAQAAEGKPAKAFGAGVRINKSKDDGLSVQQRKSLDALITRYVARTPKSRASTARHRAHLADPRTVSGFRPLWKEIVYPIVTTRSDGPYLWDVDGHRYIDVINGFGTTLFGHRPEFVNDAIRQQLDRRADIHRRLRNAIENGVLDAHAQPIIDVRSGALAGAELLCRWNDPELGPISPAEFVPLAEEWGLALPLTQYMFSALFRLRASLCDAGLQTCRLSINVPGFLLREQALIDSVIAQLQAGELDGSQIMLEITEHSFVAADQRLLSHIHRLREQGIQCAVDDFGTGYASFGQLKSMPVDAVKLDRVFVQRIADDPRDAAIVSGMQRMLGDLGLTVIAEGVETPEQLEMLAAFGCPLAQGWLFDRALPSETFVAKARSQRIWSGARPSPAAAH